MLAICMVVSLAGCALPLTANESSFSDIISGFTGESQKSPKLGFGEQLSKARGQESSGKYDAARRVYKKLIAEFPNQYEPYHRLAVVADKQRRHDEAQALYAQAIRIEPKNAELFNDLGYSYYLDGELGKSERAILKAVSLEPTNSRFRNNLGLVIGQQGRFSNAFTQFSTAGSKADAHFNMAFLFASNGEYEQAKRSLRLAVAFDPRHEAALKALESFERYESDPDAITEVGEFVKNGIRWVPYVEGDQQETNSSDSSQDSSTPASNTGGTSSTSQDKKAQASPGG